MCTCNKAKHANRKNGNDSCPEPNPRLILAVVSVGVIVGALFAPSRQTEPTLASNSQPKPAASTTSR